MAAQENTQAATETSAPAPATESSALIREAGAEREARVQHSHLTILTSGDMVSDNVSDDVTVLP